MRHIIYKVILIVSLAISSATNAVNLSHSVGPAPTAPNSFADIVEPLIPSVVNIYTVQYIKKQNHINKHFSIPFGEFREFFKEFENIFPFEDVYSNPRATSLGSGFIINPEGYIVTNNHVVAEADEINIKLHNGKELEAKVIGTDSRTDLALLKIDTKEKLSFVEFGDDNEARIGDWVIAIGNPFGLGQTVTAGIISSKSRDIESDSKGIVDNYIQTDAAINRGNSGGPMFNLKGQVIGVNTAIYSASGSSSGVGFAIPSSTVKSVISNLQKYGKVERGLLNIKIQSITPEILEALGLKEGKGIFVNDVEKGGAGDKCGLKSGDVILKFEGKDISSVRELQTAVANSKIGCSVKITIQREGKERELVAKIEPDTDLSENRRVDRKENKELNENDNYKIDGITFSTITLKATEVYNLPEGVKGVVITNVERTSQAHSYIRPGDVLISLNQKHVSSVKDIKSIHTDAKSKGKRHLVVILQRGNAKIVDILNIEKH